ncbi:MAG: NmrA/HSCARG family protein [Gemmatimonadota bacterium]
MAEKKIIAVVGATGAQGGGVAHAILADPNSEFAVRAITRDVDSDKAKALAAAGAEIVSADVDDLESLTRAFEGAYGAFCVTFFWAHFSPERELASATNMAQAAKAAGLQHVIWSTLEDVREFVPLDDARMPTLQGKYKVPHFDAKGEADQAFIERGVPTTFLYASFYWDNFIYFGSGPKRGPDGALALTLPIGQAKMAGVASEDIGKVAYGIFRQGTSLIGEKIGVAGELLTGDEMASAMSTAIGQQVRYNEVSPDIYRSFGFPGADDLGNMFQFYRDFEQACNTMRDVERAKTFAPDIQSFDEWLEKHAKQIPLD